MSELIMSYLTTAILVVSIIAFVISVITEVTKKLPFLNKIPTDIEVIVLAIFFSVVAFIVYAQYASIVITWYMIGGAVVAGFFVAFVAMFGWDKLYTLWQRFKKD